MSSVDFGVPDFCFLISEPIEEISIGKSASDDVSEWAGTS
jgi:hypothetical protein